MSSGNNEVESRTGGQGDGSNGHEIRPKSALTESLLSSYPSFFRRAYDSNHTVLMSGINFDRISHTEKIYFLLRSDGVKELQGDPNVLGNDLVVPAELEQSIIATNGNEPERRATSQEDKKKDDTKNNEHCVCQKSQSPHGEPAMIACDLCSQWFHILCVNVSKAESNLLSTRDNIFKWFCKNCYKKGAERKKNDSS